MRTSSLVSLALLTLGILLASSCIQGIGGEGQACSSDGKCAVGLFCESNVCHAPNAGVGGSVATSGGAAASGGASVSGGGSAGDGPSEAGGADASGGKDGAGGAESSGGTEGESGGSESSGGAESSGGSSASGGSDPGPSGTNLLENGDFSDGEAHWKCDCGSATSKGVKDGAYCIEGSGDVGIALSAPGEGEDPFALEGGKTYTLYYHVKGTGSWKSKVGLAVDPYTPFGEWDDSASSAGSYKTVTHDFTVDQGDERVGFIFQGTVKGSACFDDVFIGLKE